MIGGCRATANADEGCAAGSYDLDGGAIESGNERRESDWLRSGSAQTTPPVNKNLKTY